MDMKFLDIQPQVRNLIQNQTDTKNNKTLPTNAFEKKAWETAETFEAVFLSQILKSMSIGIKADGPFGGGQGEEVFQDVLSEQIASQIARNGGIGLSHAVYKEILKTQEVNDQNVK